MSRYAIWTVNAALFVLCAFLTASLINGWLAAWLAAPPEHEPPAAPPAAAEARSWADRQIVLQRNLFQVSTLLPEPDAASAAPDPEEELEATRLPLRLLGTVAASDPAEAWAAVEDVQQRKTLVVRARDPLLGKARVVRIERRRIVLENEGRREELALDEDGAPARPVRTAARAPAPARTPAPSDVGDLRDRIRQLADDRFEVQRGDVQQVMRNPAELFSQARILPKYQDGAMVGVQLNAIQPDSLFEQIGIQNGDVITSVNGIVISSPQDSAALLKELTESNEFDVSVVGADGQERTLQYVVEP